MENLFMVKKILLVIGLFIGFVLITCPPFVYNIYVIEGIERGFPSDGYDNSKMEKYKFQNILVLPEIVDMESNGNGMSILMRFISEYPGSEVEVNYVRILDKGELLYADKTNRNINISYPFYDDEVKKELYFGFVWTDIAQILPKSPNKNLDLYISIIGDNGETIIHYEVEVKKRIDLAFPT